MVPNIDTQLQGVIKSLTDNVVPAVERTNKAAVEQLGLVIATLNMVRSRLPLARQFARVTLAERIQLADELAPVLAANGDRTAALSSLVDSARTLLVDPACDTEVLEREATSLGNAISAWIDSCKDTEVAPTILKIALSQSASQIERLRSWCLPAGFESSPADFRDITELV